MQCNYLVGQLVNSALRLHYAHPLLIATPQWFQGLLVLPQFHTLPAKVDVIGADSSLFSAVKQRKGTATAGSPLKQRGQLCGHLCRTDLKIKLHPKTGKLQCRFCMLLRYLLLFCTSQTAPTSLPLFVLLLC